SASQDLPILKFAFWALSVSLCCSPLCSFPQGAKGPKYGLFDIVDLVPPIAHPAQGKDRQNGIPDKTGRDHLFPTGITVEARQIEVDPEIGHHDTGEGHDADKVEGPSAPKAGDQTHVEDKGIYHDGNQGPGLPGVPSPVPAPALIGPMAPEKVPDREHHQANGKTKFTDDGKLLDGEIHSFLVPFRGHEHQ